MHLGTSPFCRVLYRRLLSRLFAVLVGCAALFFSSSGGRVLADEGGMSPTPEITNFECRLEGGWIIITGTVNTAGTVEITGLTVFSFTVDSAQQFSEQVAYTSEMQGNIFAQMWTVLGPISELVWDTL